MKWAEVVPHHSNAEGADGSRRHEPKPFKAESGSRRLQIALEVAGAVAVAIFVLLVPWLNIPCPLATPA